MKKLIITPQGEQVLDLTAEEIAQKEIDEQNAIAEKELLEQEKLDKEQANQSAIDKLKALGLTNSEIEAFRGK
jgi:phenylalanine-4-hydroxylase